MPSCSTSTASGSPTTNVVHEVRYNKCVSEANTTKIHVAGYGAAMPTFSVRHAGNTLFLSPLISVRFAGNLPPNTYNHRVSCRLLNTMFVSY